MSRPESSTEATAAVLPAPALSSEGATPVMAQFFEAKARQPDALVFFRMGDFYELFFEDAIRGQPVARHRPHLSGQACGRGHRRCAGVPAHAADAYLSKLIRAGFKVAVCDQVEDPAEAKKRGSKSIVRREVTRVVTPGTLTEDALLDARGANRLAAVAVRGGQAALASVEVSTGEVEVTRLDRSEIAPALAALRPSELLVVDRLFTDEVVAPALKTFAGFLQPLPSALGDPAAAADRLQRLYRVGTLDGFGDFSPAEVSALGLIAAHLETTQAGKAPALNPPRRAGASDHLIIDPATRHSLEIERTQTGGREGSLVACLDRTVTSAGARRLADRIGRPLAQPAPIAARLDAVEHFVDRRPLREKLRAALRGSADMARALSRLALGRGGPRDLGALRDGLTAGETISALVAHSQGPLAQDPAEIAAALAALDLHAKPALAHLLRRLREGLSAELPLLARDGGYVAEGFRPDLDETRRLRDDSRRVIAALEARLQGETGLNIRIRHNAVLGYFIDATAKQAETLLQPPWSTAFVHRQTTANQVRFTTPELAELDAKISQAASRALAIEAETFALLRDEAVDLASEIHAAAAALAELDVASALAEWAEEVGAVRPEIDASTAFEAQAARHPVVEAAVRRAGDPYTPNDCRLDGDGTGGCPRLAIVTGPNMAGKSTFLRQNALLVVLAQAGSFVPGQAVAAGRGRSPVQPRRRRRRPGAGPLHLHDRDGGDRRYPHPGHAQELRGAGRDRPRHRHLRWPGNRLGLHRGPARHQPLPHPLRHPLSRARPARRPPRPRLQPVAARQGVERRAGVPARSRPRRSRPQLWRAGSPAGRRPGLGGGPRQGGAGASGKRARLPRAARRPAPVRGREGDGAGVHRTLEGGKGA